MSITGNVKFFEKNLIDENATFVFTSASSVSESFLYDRSVSTKFNSIGSDDATPEVLTITFATSKTFNRLLMNVHNIKSGTIKYWDGVSAYVDFSVAATISGNADETSYFEFDSVTTTAIQLTLSTTMIVDAEKLVAGLYAFLEIGTLSFNPARVKKSYVKSGVQRKSSTGGSINVIFGKKYEAAWSFTDCPVGDVAILESLDNLGTPFFIWPCGGVGLADYGFRLRDIYFVNYMNDFNPNQKNNLPNIATIINCDFEEV